jgi:hypothetical protein
MDLYVRLALRTRQPLSELMSWEPKALSSALQWLEQQDRAEAKGK